MPERIRCCWERTAAWSSRWNKTCWLVELSRVDRQLTRLTLRVWRSALFEWEALRVGSRGWQNEMILLHAPNILYIHRIIYRVSNYAITPCDFLSNRRPNQSIYPKSICHHTWSCPKSNNWYVFCCEVILIQSYTSLESSSVEVGREVLTWNVIGRIARAAKIEGGTTLVAGLESVRRWVNSAGCRTTHITVHEIHAWGGGSFVGSGRIFWGSTQQIEQIWVIGLVGRRAVVGHIDQI